MARREDTEPFYPPNLFNFNRRPLRCTRWMTDMPRLTTLVCDELFVIDNADLGLLKEEDQAVLLMHSLIYNLSLTTEKILMAWPTPDFQLSDKSCNNFIKTVDDECGWLDKAPYHWSKFLTNLCCCFASLIFKNAPCKVVNMEIQDFPHISSPYLIKLLDSFRKKKTDSGDDVTKQYTICLNIDIKDSDSLHALVDAMGEYDFLKLKVHSVRFDFNEIVPNKDLTVHHLNALDNLLHKLTLSGVSGMQMIFFTGANFTLKKIITNLFHGSFLANLTSLSLVKYFNAQDVMLEFLKYCRAMQNLVSLSFGYSPLVTRSMSVIEPFSCLKTLRLVRVGLSEFDLEQLYRNKTLLTIEHFDISFNKLDLPERVRTLCQLLDGWKNNLKTFEFRYISWKPDHFDVWALDSIKLELLERINFSGNRISSYFLESILWHETLKQVICDDPTIENRFAEFRRRVDLPFIRRGGTLTPFDVPLFSSL